MITRCFFSVASFLFLLIVLGNHAAMTAEQKFYGLGVAAVLALNAIAWSRE